MKDFINQCECKGLTARIKRLSDQLNTEGRKMYAYLGYDIEPNWFLVFLSLKEQSLSVTEIAQRLHFSHPAIVKIIKKMKERGYVKSIQDKKDSRKQLLSLTAKSKNRLPEFERVWNNITQVVDECITEGFIESIQYFEDKMREQSLFERFQELHLKSNDTVIIEYDNKYKADFARLNYEWLNKYFYIEEYDKKVLGNPEQYIINKGGVILFAVSDNKVVGTLALINRGKEGYELSKMAVTENYQGQKIGQKLMDKAMYISIEMGIRKLILESNTILEAAIRLYEKVGFQEIPIDEMSPYNRSNIKMEFDLTQYKTT